MKLQGPGKRHCLCSQVLLFYPDGKRSSSAEGHPALNQGHGGAVIAGPQPNFAPNDLNAPQQAAPANNQAAGNAAAPAVGAAQPVDNRGAARPPWSPVAHLHAIVNRMSMSLYVSVRQQNVYVFVCQSVLANKNVYVFVCAYDTLACTTPVSGRLCQSGICFAHLNHLEFSVQDWRQLASEVAGLDGAVSSLAHLTP